MRKAAEDIKNGKKELGFWGRVKKIRFTPEEKQNKKESEEKKHSFSQQQLSDFDKKMDDELFRVKMRTLATSTDRNRPKKIIDDISRLFNWA